MLKNENVSGKNSNEQILGDKKTKENGDGLIFFKRVLSGVIDQIIVIAASLIILLIFNLVIKVFGYYFAEREQVFFILYVIINVLYTPICASTKLKKTIGSKITLNK